MLKFILSGEIFENRKEAKLKMGHANYNRALSAGQIEFIQEESSNQEKDIGGRVT